MASLYLVPTPIGNLEDMTYRAVRVLRETEALACEDTRRTRVLLEHYGIPKPKTVFSYHEHNELAAGRRILGLLDAGVSVAVCSNAGYPGVSDPGFRIVSGAIEAGHDVIALPGASAVHVALVQSGLPTSSYVFKGFPPRKSGARRRFLALERDLPHTLVLYESPFRIGALLADAFAELGNRRAAVCIELTKMFEDVRRGSLAELAGAFENTKVKGEITVVIAGNHPKFLDAETAGDAG
ncbi:MAG: 16S rRNA (cytidine(1402)-2'-O)-methyltransferase [Candidatus Hydrogenedentes bacterium]|jgi:16S rRNA (cytidine1402-2'-O)-methyltransferase|nr:16S rRNA (cytidine(1402)-2'-O)-methyltransferase [Candidatus Hydrogenedentota bacterium]MDY0033514.1 16S rRNA (cytidine(1402)-2'-O)-methyltransferase [FCB group bacterium]NLT60769.1 16S rRNA (cytidine(1402)-2'-O)-methyltransferase [Candidatus Hydrogenedentota bacterium]HNV20833.1 16S rRNA (cytidine(1402)-2'-O)-methyltransferase [Candidatus Hydrogenedentota bacterium]HNZ18556.1 16S rRNA (cytidine(1402)-2'-O)-methyltransferase [Candidatus Hydrogenedentota bacterium]